MKLRIGDDLYDPPKGVTNPDFGDAITLAEEFGVVPGVPFLRALDNAEPADKHVKAWLAFGWLALKEAGKPVTPAEMRKRYQWNDIGWEIEPGEEPDDDEKPDESEPADPTAEGSEPSSQPTSTSDGAAA